MVSLYLTISPAICTVESKLKAKDTFEAYCSLMKLAILGLSGLLLLTGCASSPSLENQIKLIQYQTCLEKQENIDQSVRDMLVLNNRSNQATIEYFLLTGKPDPKTGLISSLEVTIKNCAKYRP